MFMYRAGGRWGGGTFDREIEFVCFDLPLVENWCVNKGPSNVVVVCVCRSVSCSTGETGSTVIRWCPQGTTNRQKIYIRGWFTKYLLFTSYNVCLRTVLHCLLTYSTSMFVCVLRCLFVYCDVCLCTAMFVCVLQCLFTYCTAMFVHVLYCTLMFVYVLYCNVCLRTVLQCLFTYCTAMFVYLLQDGKVDYSRLKQEADLVKTYNNFTE